MTNRISNSPTHSPKNNTKLLAPTTPESKITAVFKKATNGLKKVISGKCSKTTVHFVSTYGTFTETYSFEKAQ